MQNSTTLLPFENTLINVNLLTHATKVGDHLYLYFANSQEPHADLIFAGESARLLWNLLISHEKAQPTRVLKF